MAGGGDTASMAGRGARQRRTLGEQQPVAARAGERELGHRLSLCRPLREERQQQLRRESVAAVRTVIHNQIGHIFAHIRTHSAR